MSGLRDIASWALRGANLNDDDNNNAEGENASSSNPPLGPPLSEEEMRDRRLARIAAMQEKQQQEQAEAMQTDENYDNDKMQVDTTSNSVEAMDVDQEEKKPPPKKKEPVKKASPPKKVEPPKEPSPERKKKRAKESTTPENASRKLQRKKELLLKKVLNISIQDGDGAYEVVPVEEITVSTIAEILAMRLSMSPSDLKSVSRQQTELIPYLASCHRRAAEELKTLKQSKANTQELEELLNEILKQLVSYAASSLMEPDLFEMAKDGTTQLAKALINGTTDLASSITFGVTGTSSSFYHCLCEELILQDNEAFLRVIADTVTYLTNLLSKCDSVLDGGAEGGLVLVSALTALCGHKKAALAMTQSPNFLLPPAESPQAQERITPPPPSMPPNATPQQQQIFRLMQAMNRGANTGYLKRSGPALDKETLLGLVMRLGCPRDSPAVASSFGNILNQSVDSVDKIVQSHQRQLRVYQDTVNQLIRCLITAGADSRYQVRFINDCRLVGSNERIMLNALLLLSLL